MNTFVSIFLYILAFIQAPLHAVLSVENAYFELGLAFKTEGDSTQAINNFKNVLTRNPKNKQALLHIAHELYAQKSWSDGMPYLQKFLELEPTHELAQHYLAQSYARTNQAQASIKQYTDALLHNPTSLILHQGLADLLFEQNAIEQAIDCYKNLLSLNAHQHRAYLQLARLYNKSSDYLQAIGWYDQLLEQSADHEQALFEKANILAKLGNAKQALGLYDRLLLLNTPKDTVLYNKAQTFKYQGDFAQANSLYLQCLEISPSDQGARIGLAQCMCAQGMLAEGFKEFYIAAKLTRFELPTLEQVRGKTVLILGDWNIDTMLLLLRYVQLLKEHGAIIVLQSPKILLKVLQQCPYIDFLVEAESRDVHRFHYSIPILALPAVFNQPLKHLPTDPYIFAPKNRRDFWVKRLATDKQLKIGIYLQDNKIDLNPARDTNVPITILNNLACIDGISVYSLQESFSATDYMPHCGIVHTFGTGIPLTQDSLKDLCAIISTMDLIVTKDTTVAHLAGALGIPVWVLLPYGAEWYWMLQSTSCAWYPTMRLFRQQEPGNWQPVINTVCAELTTFSRSKR